MKPQKKIFGDLAEKNALEYLEKQGLKLIQKNFQCRLGEIDLIMREQKTVVFIEVRARSALSFMRAEESIHFHKQQKLMRTAELYLKQTYNNQPPVCRFDVIAINQSKIDWIKNAFQA